MRVALGGLMIVLVLGGCASLPPQKPITSLEMLAGAWAGTLYTRGGALEGQLTINPDGTWVSTIPKIPPGTFNGTVKIENGKGVWLSKSTGNTGTFTLYESATERWLISEGSAGGEGRYQPVR